MSLPSFSLETCFALLAAAAFAAGGVANATGHPKIRDSFVHLGFPGWWCWPTAGLELLAAVMLIFSATRIVGMALGTAIMLVAIAAILRAGLWQKLPPPLVFLVLLGLAALTHHA